ncbi:MAG: DUF3800 domain-containing protein [Chitinophagales bacterium]|nr:DUF3800 domain-containing protein [Chitinophagales bacterium]
MVVAKSNIKTNHRFLDEAGDTAFYGKGKKTIIGSEGVSGCFILGMVKFKEPLEPVRKKIVQLQNQVANDPYYQVPSILKRKQGAGYYFHATDDLPEVRKTFFDFIKSTKCSFEAVVGRKTIERYETLHKGKEEYFYADLLSHLLKNKMEGEVKLILNIAERGRSTKNNNLLLAMEKAKERVAENINKKNAEITASKVTRHDIITNVAFNVVYPTQEPLLNVADYFCWAVQRVFEKGETRFYDYLKEQVSLIVDLYDTTNYKDWRNYYNSKNSLSAKNKISPPLH